MNLLITELSNAIKIEMFQRNSNNFIILITRRFSSKIKPKVEVNQDVINKIEDGSFKPRKHPGIFKPRTIHLPKEFVVATEKALEDYPAKQLLTDSKILTNYLRARRLPTEHHEYMKKRSEIEKKLMSEYGDTDTLTELELYELRENLKPKVNKLLKTKLYMWKPMEYTVHSSLQYLLGRSAAEYAALVRIFQEINIRDKDFKPRSFFDFGSGVGTGTWAAKLFWGKNIFEYFNVDSCVHMNDLSLILLKGGTGVRESNLKGVFYRQFLPATNATYDLVISAYSLLELPSSESRLETILKLWNKTQDYLVIVEQGTSTGFKVVNEARDFILQLKDQNSTGHVFSPCPHDQICPKFLNDVTPCNFEICYMSIPVGQKSELQKELFSYVVLRKGKRKNETDFWPRLVEPTLLRSKHAICRMCTSQGTLEEVIFTDAKHGRIPYRCAKASQWGDLLPMTIDSIKDNKNN